MARQLSDEEILKIANENGANITQKDLDDLNKPKPYEMSEDEAAKRLEELAKKEGYDYESDYNKIKNSLLATSYSPYTNKTYTTEEKEALTKAKYYDELMGAANHLEESTTWGDVGQSALKTALSSLVPGLNIVATPALAAETATKALNTNEGKTFLWGVNEGTGGTGVYKAAEGGDAVQNRLNQMERVYGNNQFARGLGKVVGRTGSIVLGSLLGGKPGAAIASGLSSIGETYTYNDNPVDIAVSGLTSGLGTLAFMGIADKLKSFFPIFQSTGANFLKNAGIGATAGYATSALSELGTNVGKAIKGEEVTGEDWLKSFYGMDNLMSAGISALSYGALGTIADKQQAQLNLQTAKNDYQEGLNALDRGDQALYNAYSKGDTAAAQEIYNQGNQILDLMESTKYDGVKIDTSKTVDPLRQMWNQKNTMYQNLFRGKLGDGSQVSTSLTTTNPVAPSTSTISAINPSVISSATVPTNFANAVIPNTGISTSQTPTIVGTYQNSNTQQTNAKPSATIDVNTTETYNNENGGISDGENNLQGLVETERNGTEPIYNENDERTLEKIRPNRDATREKEIELKEHIITNPTPEEQEVIDAISEITGKPTYVIDYPSQEIGGMTGEDGIYIDRQAIQEYGGMYIGHHEEGENLLFNHEDYAGLEISRLVNRINDSEKDNRTFTKLFKYYFKPEKTKSGGKTTGPSNETIREYAKQVEKFTKEMVFNTYAASKTEGDNNKFHEILGDDIYNDIVNSMAKLSSGRKNYTSTTSKSSKGNGGLPSFPKKKTDGLNNNQTTPSRNLTIEKQNKDIEKLEKANDTLQTKMAQEKEKNKAKLTSNAEKFKEREKQTKEKAKEKINRLKAKNKEEVKEAKASARATTTDKKMKLALNRLDNALDKVYDKPRSPEVEKALDGVRKQSRGTIKLIDKVKGKMPSKYNFFIDDVLDIVDSYYTGGNTMTDEKRASLERKSEAIEKFAKEHPEYPLSKQALSLLKEPSKKNISDLNEKDLISLAEDLQEIGTAVRDMFAFTRSSEDAVKLRAEAIDFAKQRLENGEGRNYNNLSSNKAISLITDLGENYVDKRSTIQTLTTALSGGDPNSPFNFIPDQLRNGYDRYNRAYEKMLRLFDKYIDVKKVGNVRYYNNKLNDIFDPKKTLDVELKAADGSTYKPTIRDAISVMLGVKDPQFAGHTIGVITDKVKDGKPILSEGGNVVFANNIDEKMGRLEKGLKRGVKVKLTAEDIKKIEAALEDYPIVKDLMETFKELTDLTYDLTNEPNELINGMSLEKRENYFPVNSDPATRMRQSPSDKLKGFNGQDASSTLQGMSIVKPVVEGANGQIRIYPIDQVIGKLIDSSALYNGYATALYDINTFLSARSDDGETLVELINHLDPSYLSNYGRITNALVGNVKPGGKLASTLGENYTGGILKANFWLALKQFGSYFTAAPFFDTPTRSLFAGLFKRGDMARVIKDYYKEKGIDISPLNNSQTLRYFWDDKVNAELATRTRGYSSADKKLILKHSGILERLKVFDWYKSIDIGTINALAWAMFYDMYSNPDTDIETDVFMNDLGARYIAANTSTQPNTSVVTKTPMQVDGNVLDKALSYMADPRIKNVNTLANAWRRFKWSRKNGTEEEKAKYGSAFKKIALGTLASLAYTTYVSRKKLDAEGKKKETSFWQDMVGNVFGLTIGMEQIAGKFLNDYSFDVSLPDTQALNLLLNFGEDAMKIFGSDNPEKYIDKAIQDLSGFLGIPYKNLKNDYNALTNLLDKETFYENKIKADSNMNKKYEKYKDDIYNYQEFYELYQATRQKAVTETYGKYNNDTIKEAIVDNGGDLETYYKMFKK